MQETTRRRRTNEETKKNWKSSANRFCRFSNSNSSEAPYLWGEGALQAAFAMKPQSTGTFQGSAHGTLASVETDRRHLFIYIFMSFWGARTRQLIARSGEYVDGGTQGKCAQPQATWRGALDDKDVVQIKAGCSWTRFKASCCRQSAHCHPKLPGNAFSKSVNWPSVAWYCLCTSMLLGDRSCQFH